MTLHTIPVGGEEPVHICGASCWCNPLVSETLVTHNASDLREARERHGNERKGELWVIIQQEEPK